jgi:hypothetical protein
MQENSDPLAWYEIGVYFPAICSRCGRFEMMVASNGREIICERCLRAVTASFGNKVRTVGVTVYG